MRTGAASFGDEVVHLLRVESDLAAFLLVRARGKTATIGVMDADEWVPLLRMVNGSGAFNVMDLQVRHKRSWARTGHRGIPAALVTELLGPLRFTWEMEAEAARDWQRTSDPEH